MSLIHEELNLVVRATQAAERLRERVASERERIQREMRAIETLAASSRDGQRAAYLPSGTYLAESTGKWELSTQLAALIERPEKIDRRESLEAAARAWSDFLSAVREHLEGFASEREPTGDEP